ncbi:alkane 1-monooxygenase [Marinigracilibium pacificum]|uniref:Alkane 1-monooxygenase n=1 Tax=Marinigracilibium pacificum TaxID=2729599 RepID=A0A848IVF5_9BACT|nr:alkane 1-monooxygenase [Marinigracilibium pacificum]NMM47168.1 alkane 1-monooxygenase [Marinigracilibium pacificum]
MKILKYSLVLILPVLVVLSFYQKGISTYFPIIYAFGIIPLLELIFKPDPTNISSVEEELRKKDLRYDLVVYLMVPVQYFVLFMFLFNFTRLDLVLYEKIGMVLGMGMMCGVIGINVAHELGHRKKDYEKVMARMLLLTSLYMHFYIEHNRGHHKNVSTPEDPASARYNETVYGFYFRSIYNSYMSAWKIANDQQRKNRSAVFSLKNEMLQYQLIQILFSIGVYFLFGIEGLLAFLGAALIGILLLETVNYIEHYGLQRKQVSEGRYERVLPLHSWNSDHVVGRLMLFELSRHSDHHYIASRPYQILMHHDNSPQMPTGYPGMMIMALFPPIWFKIMNKKADDIRNLVSVA